MTGVPELAALPLAAVDAVDSYRRGIYGPPPEDSSFGPLVIGGVVLVVFLVAVYAYDRWQKIQTKAAAPAKRTLFGDLCSGHGLTAAERQSLEALAAQEQIEPASAIFVRPELVAALAESSSQPEVWQSIQEKAYGDWS